MNSVKQLWKPTGAILFGGQSKRMGAPKEDALLWDNRSMIEHVFETLACVTSKIVLVGRQKDINLQNTVILEDSIPYRGPLSGLETLLSSNIDNAYLVVACDQPLITQDLLWLLLGEKSKSMKLVIEQYPAGGKEQIDPFPGYYPATYLPIIRQVMAKGIFSMYGFIRELIQTSRKKEDCGIKWLPITKEQKAQIKSINSPSDLEKLNASRRTVSETAC